MRWLFAGVCCATLLTGCSGDNGARVVGMSPNAARRDAVTEVEIVGRGFDCAADTRFDAESLAVDASFSARLGDIALSDVVWRGTESLGAVVPAGLTPGIYDLTVIRPDGRESTLPGAFTVTEPRTLEACADGDAVVATAAELAAAIADANATPGVQSVCVTTSIVLAATLTVDDGLALRGTPEGELRGEGLPAGSAGLVMSSGTSSIEGLRFSDFAGGAVRVRAGELSVRYSEFSNCSPAVIASTSLDVMGSRFLGGSAGVQATGSQGGVVAVRNSVFSKVGHGVKLKSASSLVVDNNTFYRISSESVSAEQVDDVRLRNNIFQQYGGDALELSDCSMSKPATANALSREIACIDCGFDATNLVVDCGFVDPEADRFELAPGSPCVDRGVDVGLPFEGDAPDLGALEQR